MLPNPLRQPHSIKRIHSTLRWRRYISSDYCFVSIAQVSTVVASFASIRITTELLEPKEYGHFALVLTLVTIAQQLLFGPLGVSLSRFYPNHKEAHNEGTFVHTATRIVYLSILIVLLLGAAIFFSYWLIKPAEIQSSIIYGLVIVPALSSYTVFVTLENAAQRRRRYAVIQSLTSWGRVVAIAAGCILISATVHGALAGMATFSILCIIVLSISLIRRTPETAEAAFSKPLVKQVWLYQKPMMLWGIVTGLHLSSDRWFLAASSSPTDVALYAVLYQVGYYPLMLVTDTFNRYIQPLVFQRAGDGSEKEKRYAALKLIDKTLLLTTSLTVISVIATLLLHEVIFKILVADDYRGASHLLPIIVAASGIFSIAQLASNAGMIDASPKRLLAVKIVTAIIGITLNAVLAYYYQILGVCISILIFSVIYLAWTLLIRFSSK